MSYCCPARPTKSGYKSYKNHYKTYNIYKIGKTIILNYDFTRVIKLYGAIHRLQLTYSMVTTDL